MLAAIDPEQDKRGQRGVGMKPYSERDVFVVARCDVDVRPAQSEARLVPNDHCPQCGARPASD
jgi:DNA replicative helicase MCM subunit Mcm2 (Cdc46/Mcm family)